MGGGGRAAPREEAKANACCTQLPTASALAGTKGQVWQEPCAFTTPRLASATAGFYPPQLPFACPSPLHQRCLVSWPPRLARPCHLPRSSFPAHVDRGRAPPLPPAMAAPCAAWVSAFPGVRVSSPYRAAPAVSHRRRGAALRVGPSAVGSPAGDARPEAVEGAAAAAGANRASSPVGPGMPSRLPREATLPLTTAFTTGCPRQQGEARTAELPNGHAHPLWPHPLTIGVARLLYLGVTQTPGFWASPQRALAAAATATGSPDVLTITLMGRPLLSVILSAPALAAALAAPQTVMTADPIHVVMQRTLEPPACVFRSAAEAAEAKHSSKPAMEVLNAHFREAVTHTWWWSTADIHSRLDRAIESQLAAAVGPSGVATVDLFETFSGVVVTALLSVLVGDSFAATSGREVAVALRQWERSAWSLPWVLAPTTARRLHPGIEVTYARAYQPILDAVTAVMEKKEAVQPGTYLDDLFQTLNRAGQTGIVRPTHVATQVISALFAAHVNMHASGAWTVAHVAAHADLTAAAAAEVAVADAGRPPPVASERRSPTGLPVTEAVWAEALRSNAVTLAIRVTRAPFHVPSSIPAVAGSTSGAKGGGDSHPGWTIPGDGHLVALSVAHANTGTDYYGATGSVADPHRFVPPATRSWQAAEADRRLVLFGGGVHVCIGRRIAEDVLGRVWRAFFREHNRVELVGCEGGLPPADFLRASTTAQPTRPVYVRLRRRPSAER